MLHLREAADLFYLDIYHGYDWYGRTLEVREVRDSQKAWCTCSFSVDDCFAFLRIATPAFQGTRVSVVDSEEEPLVVLEEASVEALEEEDSVVDLVVVLAVISQTKICMLITVGLIHQVVPADPEEADWQWMDTVVVAGSADKEVTEEVVVVAVVDSSRNPVSRSWFEMCVFFCCVNRWNEVS